MIRVHWAYGSDIAYIQKEPLRGKHRKHGAKRQRLQREEDVLHTTINGVGCIGRLRERKKTS
jgi:hypothetical protein